MIRLSEARQRAVIGSLAAVATEHPDLRWSAWCEKDALVVCVSLVSTHRRAYGSRVAWPFAILEHVQYLPVFDLLRGIARDLWKAELADCQEGATS